MLNKNVILNETRNVFITKQNKNALVNLFKSKLVNTNILIQDKKILTENLNIINKYLKDNKLSEDFFNDLMTNIDNSSCYFRYSKSEDNTDYLSKGSVIFKLETKLNIDFMKPESFNKMDIQIFKNFINTSIAENDIVEFMISVLDELDMELLNVELVYMYEEKVMYMESTIISSNEIYFNRLCDLYNNITNSIK